ncbi:MAG: manganese efflux pump MntP family protein [Bacteroidales bacterium]|nr:manganese efflux pump MntP family protein [Bacteroidales bacterium]MDD6622844.1 manganese efflux pump MntP family protein [Bacteroidales bacterium]
MGLLALILLSISLAMDCFSVSLAAGVTLRRFDRHTFLRMGFMFGLFQALMPLLGWSFGYSLSGLIQNFDHWLAFGLLAILGIRMIVEGFRDEEHKTFDPHSWRVLLTLSVATSIDALAVGLTFAFINMGLLQLFEAVAIIGLGSFMFALAGSAIGAYVGNKFRFPMEAIGGVVLIGIGVKILLEHLGYL